MAVSPGAEPDRTVIRDTDLNAHGTVSNDLADALVDANPNRFKEVSPSEYVKGIDYQGRRRLNALDLR
jgi:hypothetical protein